MVRTGEFKFSSLMISRWAIIPEAPRMGRVRSSLPPELIRSILSHLVPRRPRTPKNLNRYKQDLQDHISEGRRALCRLCYCSHQFRLIAQPLLYCFVLAESTERLMLLARTLSEQPDLIPKIRTLVFYFTQPGKPPQEGEYWSPESHPPRRLVEVPYEPPRSSAAGEEATFKLLLPQLPPHLQEFDGKITADLQALLWLLTAATGVKEMLVVAPDYYSQRDRFCPWGQREQCLEMLEHAAGLQMAPGEKPDMYGEWYLIQAMAEIIGPGASAIAGPPEPIERVQGEPHSEAIRVTARPRCPASSSMPHQQFAAPKHVRLTPDKSLPGFSPGGSPSPTRGQSGNGGGKVTVRMRTCAPAVVRRRDEKAM
ncbi:hypothetical protein DL771_001812 [Monosporascus sp. 5C6A]|nr:hypothetical protein DL771_001812 [Monosporascus sp. 5C6A]